MVLHKKSIFLYVLFSYAATLSLTKGDLFDVFYQPQLVSRAGGGTQKKKIHPVNVTQERMRDVERQINNDPVLMQYYNKLKNRRRGIAPPPRPTN